MPLSTSKRAACSLHEGTPEFAQQTLSYTCALLKVGLTLWLHTQSGQLCHLHRHRDSLRSLFIHSHRQGNSRSCRMCIGKPFIIMLSHISNIVVLTCCERLYPAVYSICSLLIALLA